MAVGFDFLYFGGGAAALDPTGSNGRVLVEPGHIVVGGYPLDVFVLAFEVA